MKKINSLIMPSLAAMVLLLIFCLPLSNISAQTDNPNPPGQPVKLIFIHHSTGENWLTDGYGNLGRELGEANYFVSDTNYGWGPDAIGDRTDIPNWEEWFSSPATPTYMSALFNESGQNASYTRELPDPGGENTIILFKSCFPNSDLYGEPDDPPGTYGELTVSGAKYVYNTILDYFATRPDKLFIVITAPPLSDRTNAANARAFNNWLVEDWLAENDYQLNNVAVFDFYNVLTGRNAHHWWHDGKIERVLGSKDTLAYPSGDDHPSEAGSRKATEEFIPLLNVFYHRWAAGAPAGPVASGSPTTSVTSESINIPLVAGGSSSAGMLADFEMSPPTLEAFWDEATTSQVTCAVSAAQAAGGSASLQIDADVVSGSWGTCRLTFAVPPDLGAGAGLAFKIHAGKSGLPYEVILYAGDLDNPQTYEDYASTPDDSLDGWADVVIPWEEFTRVAWEEDAGKPFDPELAVSAIAIGFNGLDAANNTGTLWVDDFALAGPVGESAAEPVEEPGESESDGGSALPCTGGVVLPLVLTGLVILARKKAIG